MFKKAALAYAKRRAVSEARKTAAGGTAGIMAKVRVRFLSIHFPASDMYLGLEDHVVM